MTDPEQQHQTTQLMRDAAGFQVKVLLEALRDLVLSPLSLIATLADLALLSTRKPTFFYAVLKLGERSEHWIDLWSAASRGHRETREGEATPNADWLLDRVEALIRDPRSGKKNALVLKRWAQIRLSSASRNADKPDGDPPPAPPTLPP
jgi:hypothetical protein